MFLVESALESVRHRVFNYLIYSINRKKLKKKLENFTNNLKCEAKMNLTVAFHLKNTKERAFRYFYAHERKPHLNDRNLVYSGGFTLEENTRQPYIDKCFLSRAFALHLRGKQNLEEGTSKNLQCDINRKDGGRPNRLPGARMKDHPVSGNVTAPHSLTWDEYCGLRLYWRTCKTTCGQIWEHCTTTDKQQSQMLHEQQQCSVQVFSLSRLWYFVLRERQIWSALKPQAIKEWNKFTNIMCFIYDQLFPKTWTLLRLNTWKSRCYSKI